MADAEKTIAHCLQLMRGGKLQNHVDPALLVLTDRLDMADHLARHRLADLFLDTLPYNAHSSACDALWAGLPVV
jgi:protein O-GlcNAc transferase